MGIWTFLSLLRGQSEPGVVGSLSNKTSHPATPSNRWSPIVGFDNIGIARWYDPSLTTVDQPRHQMGERAMQELLKRFENPSARAEVVKFETSLIIRRSSRPLSEA